MMDGSAGKAQLSASRTPTTVLTVTGSSGTVAGGPGGVTVTGGPGGDTGAGAGDGGADCGGLPGTAHAAPGGQVLDGAGAPAPVDG